MPRKNYMEIIQGVLTLGELKEHDWSVTLDGLSNKETSMD
jgi:hypothetical protein